MHPVDDTPFPVVSDGKSRIPRSWRGRALTHKEDIMGEKGKTVFITGGSTGIGAACVRKFAGEGWNVAFMDINA